MLALLPADHQACFFLCGAFLKHLPPDIRAHLVNDSTTDPLSLALHTNRIYQSRVSSASTMNYVSSNPEECPVPPVRAPPASPPCSQSSPTPGPRPCCSDYIFSLPRYWLTFPLLVSWEPCRPGTEVLCTVFLVGKLTCQQVDIFSLPAGSTSFSLVNLQDMLSSRRFLEDSRTSVSVFPAPASSSSSDVKLLTADGLLPGTCCSRRPPSSPPLECSSSCRCLLDLETLATYPNVLWIKFLEICHSALFMWMIFLSFLSRWPPPRGLYPLSEALVDNQAAQVRLHHFQDQVSWTPSLPHQLFSVGQAFRCHLSLSSPFWHPFLPEVPGDDQLLPKVSSGRSTGPCPPHGCS